MLQALRSAVLIIMTLMIQLHMIQLHMTLALLILAGMNLAQKIPCCSLAGGSTRNCHSAKVICNACCAP